jgi:glycosyltransferase involved in cell wall biosynthesis
VEPGDSICEIRVPTYRRPTLLRRALQSVAGQTHPYWRCVVFDDCPNGSAREIVETFDDSRFLYCQNERPLGAIGNIDQCFRNRPFAGGSYACVVEDDNFLFPEHLERQLQSCARHHVDVTFSAQLCEIVIIPGEPGELTEVKTLAPLYPSGAQDFRDMLPAVLFSHAFSNGAAFWRLGGEVDFEMGDATRMPGIQETARMLRLKGSVYVSHEATAVWRGNDPRESSVNKAFAPGALNKLKQRWLYFTERRQVMALRTFYIHEFGVDDAIKFSARHEPPVREHIERSLLLCGKYIVLSGRSSYWRLSQMIRGYASRALIPSRVDLRKLRPDWCK